MNAGRVNEGHVSAGRGLPAGSLCCQNELKCVRTVSWRPTLLYHHTPMNHAHCGQQLDELQALTRSSAFLSMAQRRTGCRSQQV